MATCIWCLTENATPSVEHIIPDALGCPEGFMLSDGAVCRSCNSGLAHLDQAVIDDFDIFAFMANVPRKGGRSPFVKGRGNLVATQGSDGPVISINMESQVKEAHDGTRLGAFGKSKRNIEAALTRHNNLGTISFSSSIGENPKFARGITKIAFSSLAYFRGAEVALSEHFAPVRAFVRNGVGKRPVLMMLTEDMSYWNSIEQPCQTESGEYAVALRIAMAEFFVDLSPDLSWSSMIQKKLLELYGSKNWTWLPPEAKS